MTEPKPLTREELDELELEYTDGCSCLRCQDEAIIPMSLIAMARRCLRLDEKDHLEGNCCEVECYQCAMEVDDE